MGPKGILIRVTCPGGHTMVSFQPISLVGGAVGLPYKYLVFDGREQVVGAG